MKPFNYFIFLIVVIWLSCNSYKSNFKNVFFDNCTYCDSLLAQTKQFNYPYRIIDKNINGTPLFSKHELDSTIDYRETLQVFTELEIQEIKNTLFCFLGQSDNSIGKYFDTNMTRVVWFEDDNRKALSYDYNIGKYINKFNPLYKTNEKSDSSEFWLLGREQLDLTFKKINDEYLYAGTQQDSLRWLECVKEKR